MTEREKAAFGQELAVLVEMTQNCIAENARVAQDQGEYQKRYNGLVERYEKAKARFDEWLWGAMVDCVTVGVDGGMAVVFQDGTGIKI